MTTEKPECWILKTKNGNRLAFETEQAARDVALKTDEVFPVYRYNLDKIRGEMS